MDFVQVYFIFALFIVVISAKKTDTWPPVSLIYKHYDVDYIVKTCYERSGVDKKHLIEFELTEDLEHLPNSPEIKSFLRCYGEESEGVETKSNKILLSKFADYFGELTQEEQKIYINMARGCRKKTKDIKDLIEFTYDVSVCLKQNDNEHFYIFY